MWRRVFVVGVLLLLLTATLTEAKEFCTSGPVREWANDRDTAVVRLLKQWIRGAPRDVLRSEGFELLRLQVLLASCIPPRSAEDLYPIHPDLERMPAAVLQEFLTRQGVRLDPRQWLVGKTFFLSVQE